jgi:alpha-D-ribose 1-methylphosphonate 5-triphosphate synthase subunit PhnH
MDHPATINQHTAFRAVLQAMSRPGSVQQLPPPLDGELPVETLLGCLVDNEVSMASIGNGSDAVLDRVVSMAGCRRASLGDADMVLIVGGSSQGALEVLRRGTGEYPEQGATVIYLLDKVVATGGSVQLRGPGIRERATPRLIGLARGELALLGTINRDFPLGIDAIFIDRSGRVTCIPRSTRIGEP